MNIEATPHARHSAASQDLIARIEAHARDIAAKTALADSRHVINYAVLSRFSGGFAHKLRSLGCAPGDRVAMLANRCALSVAAIVGTFKSGCIHVPLDPQMPAARLDYILRDIEPKVIITEADFSSMVADLDAASATVITLDDLDNLLDVSDLDEVPPDPPVSAHRPDAPAYCIYTSGSTGHPKGVAIAHRSLAPFFEGTREIYDVRQGSVCASFSPLHFDVYLMDMLFPLYEGATLHVYDDVVVPDLLFDWVRANGVTHFSAWGMMLGLIAQAEDFETAPLPRLRTILTGTDVPDIKTVQRWLAKNDGTCVINAYGPTEVTCASTAHLIQDIEPDRKALYPIGKPLKHVRAGIVDDQGAWIETPGVSGELLVGGVQVMIAYWNRPDLTDARVELRDGVRYYRTGDVCSYLTDGSIYYHGRKDNEVNIGGRRVHLNEIQRVICAVPEVHSAEIVLLETPYAEQVLAAAVLLNSGQSDDVNGPIAHIRERLRRELPDYMIPRHVDVMPRFPLLSSGKPDRKAILDHLRSEHSTA
ncbi:MAG: amino acid adenylation domain-containing protein [Alphaproteobacteria bacterium]|nr:amino acid adenylation domain-containing protein [Alphaproteobacteria bacterium]